MFTRLPMVSGIGDFGFAAIGMFACRHVSRHVPTANHADTPCASGYLLAETCRPHVSVSKYALLAARYVLGRLTCAHTQAVDFTRFTLTRSLYCKWYLRPALDKIPPYVQMHRKCRYEKGG